MPAEVTQNGPAGTDQSAADGGGAADVRPEIGDRKPESQQQPERSASDAIMDHLDIPEEVRAQLSTHAKKEPKKADESNKGPAGEEEDAGSQDDDEHEEIRGESEEEDDGEHQPPQGSGSAGEDDDEDGVEVPKFVKDLEDPKLRKKLEKRFGRLTRKNARLEGELDAAFQELDGFRTQAGAQAHRAATAGPQGQGMLGQVRTEGELNDAIVQAKAVRKLVADNPEGLQVGEGAEAKFHPPEELKKWDLNAQEVLLDAEPRRRELREFHSERQKFDAASREDFPDHFDAQGNWRKDTPEWQSMLAISRRFPELAGKPEANYYLLATVEGFKALAAKQKSASRTGSNGNPPRQGSGAAGAEGGRKRYIDPKAFAPRVPLAPHTAGPGGGERAPSAQKKVDKAMDNVVEQGGSHESLVAAIRAKREAMPSQRSNEVLV